MFVCIYLYIYVIKTCHKGSTACYDCSKLSYAVKVTNTGTVTGDAVVLGFVSSKGIPANNATRWLFDFGRAAGLVPGASAVVTLQFDGGCKQAVSLVDTNGTTFRKL